MACIGSRGARHNHNIGEKLDLNACLARYLPTYIQEPVLEIRECGICLVKYTPNFVVKDAVIEPRSGALTTGGRVFPHRFELV